MLTPDELRARIATYVRRRQRARSRRPSPPSSPRTASRPIRRPTRPTSAGPPSPTFFANGIAASDWLDLHRQGRAHLRVTDVAIDFEIAVETGGATMVIDGIEVFAVDADGLFTSVHAYWDDADVSV